ncbi:MAG TPA: TolC family protein [Gemmatimonadales bacterium]|jgi:outer membrane protein TolC|nr:TolC family protein [Gemmatimonadales bacterium]
MPRITMSCLGLLVAMMGRDVAAQSTAAGARLRLGELYRRVEAANPRVGAAAARARAAEARISPTRRPPDPQLQFGLMNRSLPGFGLADPLGMNQVQLMQMIPFPGKLGMAGQVASSKAEAERARSADVAWDVRARAAMAFYELYRMDHSLQVADETLRILRDLATTASSMYSVGEGRQADVLRAQVEVARMSEDITRMQTERVSAAARLNALLSLDPSTPVGVPVQPAFPDTLPPLDSLVAEAERNRPMVLAAAAEVRAADAGVRLARREIWPDFQVGVQYGQRPMDGGTDRMVSLMLGVNLPVFAGSRQLAMRREAGAMQQMAEAELAAMQADTRARVAELQASAERARRLGELYRGTILPQAHTMVDAALASYRAGNVDFMTLLDDQMTVNQYRQDLYALEAERGQALAELEMLLGRALFNPDDAALASGERP